MRQRVVSRRAAPGAVRVFRAAGFAREAGRSGLSDELASVVRWWRDNGRPDLAGWGDVRVLWAMVEEAESLVRGGRR